MEILIVLIVFGTFYAVAFAIVFMITRLLGTFGGADEHAEEQFALRLRKDHGLRDFRKEFSETDIPESVLKAAFDLIWLDALWKRPIAINRVTRLAEIYDEGHRIEDVARVLAEKCGVERGLSESGARTPETVGELMEMIHFLQTRKVSEEPRNLLRPASADSSLLLPAAATRTPNERLVRIVHSGNDELKGLDP